MKKAKIIKYYQVVDENGIAIDTAHTHRDAMKIKIEYDSKHGN